MQDHRTNKGGVRVWLQGPCLHACVWRAKLLQLGRTPCNLMGCSRPGSSLCGIIQARILEWVAMPSSRNCLIYIIFTLDNKLLSSQ